MNFKRLRIKKIAPKNQLQTEESACKIDCWIAMLANFIYTNLQQQLLFQKAFALIGKIS